MEVICLECKRLMPHMGRGLCGACRMWLKKYGGMDEHPTSRRKGYEVLEDYQFIKDTHGGDLAGIAERMGMTKDALWRALDRQGVRHG